MLLGGGLFLLLAAIVCIALLRMAFENVAALEDLDTTRDSLMRESSLQAAHLNEIAMNQSLVLWHLGGALRAQLEFAEGSLFSASTRTYYRTQEGRSTLPKDPAYAFFRNALSLRSSRHFESAAWLLKRNSELLATFESKNPGFRSTLDERPVGAVFCAVGERWGRGQALGFPILSLFTAAFAGATGFSFNNAQCAFEFKGHLLAQRGAKEFLLPLDGAWNTFAQERLVEGEATPSLYLPKPDALSAWGTLLRKVKISPRASFRVAVSLEHPAMGSPAALLAPSWAAFPVEVRRDVRR